PVVTCDYPGTFHMNILNHLLRSTKAGVVLLACCPLLSGCPGSGGANPSASSNSPSKATETTPPILEHPSVSAEVSGSGYPGDATDSPVLSATTAHAPPPQLQITFEPDPRSRLRQRVSSFPPRDQLGRLPTEAMAEFFEDVHQGNLTQAEQ